MDSDGCSLTCTAAMEWLNAQGSILRKVTHKTALLRLIRDDQREMFIEIRAEKANMLTKLSLKGISVFNKFMTEGKASIKFKEQNCTLFLSNAPSSQLINFLKTIFVKLIGQEGKMITKNLLQEKFFTNIQLNDVETASPATCTEVNIAKEKAMIISRTTVTIPSSSVVRKRKRFSDDVPKIPMAKKLYENPTSGELTREQIQVLNAVLNGKNVFFTGSAGTGKSFLLRKIISALPPDVTMATASTGVAACHIGGITLHQFAGIGLGTGTKERCIQLASRPSVVSIWRKTKHLVIDEISMVDGDFFDKIEAVARHIRRTERPFGGIQLILCGDFFQLPPVSKTNDRAKFCFQSETWHKCVHFNFELQTVHRQKDEAFVKILNNIRIGRVTDDIVDILKETAKQKIESNGVLATRLCSHVKEADEINEFQLNELKSESKVYIAIDSDSSMTNMLDQQLPIPGKLILKIGAQVMLLKNINVNSGLVNGARGVVINFKNDTPIIKLRSGTHYEAKMEKWTIKTSSGAVVHRKQIPLKLAWAFSIHKSQGLTLDCVEMCLSRVFDAGQSYVALSRAQSLQSLRVLDFNSKQVWANTVVLEFYKKFRRNLQEMEIFLLGKKIKLEQDKR
ncbi:ATP-dependent DNA helicase PIF1 [Pogonomyrmex barbatus]|uniref:ATP-dependent DNA helicase PIF1 n=1 Tax=Pogonomyrmex barbatus TaxID=144034 RepID=A0A6I9WQ45_9HYME|nr:ATP-dependent DNA helicase PIF1 [Pogonomyrmex barbatus]XP_011633918.1 ATP-dependent DNA helicase PIF1 [Pogonomyrmex barbatus]XP_011633919.1 ATP-dependent DNA helicase PIF1 [Pogonomyrmex barbatus]XP_011633920.1 ATP-dependent DNA helicase PIF1 [Pogonomyrmex barbatus]XP_025073542.1 ATP-dependent DNA helicase PIF1 [Pogonomyrmex barbatus]